jgi:hypothetical protein
MARVFANAAARVAFSVDPVYEAGRRVQFLQLDTNTVYAAVRGGTGSDCWEELFPLDDLTSYLGVSLNDFREVDANTDVGAIAANGGLLASDTTPILEGDAAESWQIRWATGNTDIISAHVPLPSDFDGTQPMIVLLTVSSGTTNAASFTIESGWDGGALVSTASDDSATKSATKHVVSTSIPAASIPDTARNLTLTLTAPAHATDTIQLHNCVLQYERLRAA